MPRRVSLWDLMYVWRAPWDMDAPRPELVDLVESRSLGRGRAIDMGCGTGDNALYLAGQGFDVVGIDLSGRAIAKARRKAATAAAAPQFIQGNVTDLGQFREPFDLVVDNGCLHSLSDERARVAYIEHIARLTRAGSHVFLRGFVRHAGSELRPLERLAQRFHAGLSADEVTARFGPQFTIEVVVEHHERQPIGPVVTTTYWLTRQ